MTRRETVSVLELRNLPADVVGCYAEPTALDQLAGIGEINVRVAPDEVLLLGKRHRLAELATELSALDATAVVIDLSSAFSIWGLRGEDRFEAFCRISELELPGHDSIAQGLICHVPAKVIVREDELRLIVSATLAHHIHERLLGACADLVFAKLPAPYEEQPVEEATVA
jgi:hypothetical protein